MAFTKPLHAYWRWLAALCGAAAISLLWVRLRSEGMSGGLDLALKETTQTKVGNSMPERKDTTVMFGEFGSSALQLVQKLAQSSWCETKPLKQKQYSLVWHKVLPHVAKALQTVEGQRLQWSLEGDMYMFGVAAGADGMPLVHRLFPKHHVYGFDSFKGLPAEDHKLSKVAAWKQGLFRAKSTPGALVAASGGNKTATIIQGFYDTSLTPNLITKHNMRPAFYVDIDCDLHVSTRDAMDWLFQHQLARVGTLFGFDDFWTVPCIKFYKSRAIINPLDVGEGLALTEIAKKYGVKFHCVAGPCRMPPNVEDCHINNNWGPVFLVVAINAQDGQWSSGHEFTPEQQTSWMKEMSVCKSVGR